MTTPARTKTEAAALITRLQFAGMKRAEIARQIGVSAETVKAIAAGKSSGDAHIFALRAITPPARAAGPSATHSPAAPVSPTGEIPVPLSPTPEAAAALPAHPALDVQEAPRDERTTGQRVRENIRDAILGRSGAPASLSPRARGETNTNLAEQLIPLAALLVVLASLAVTPAKYTEVAPTQEEATAFIAPLVTAFVKQLDAAGSLTEAQLAIIQSLLAAGVYAQRAVSTFRAIRSQEAQQPHVRTQPAPQQPVYQQPQPQSSHPNPFAGAGGNSPAPFVAALPGNPASAAQSGHTPAFFAARIQPGQSNGSGGGGDAVGKTNPFAAIEQLDAIGRTRLGIN